MSDEAAYLPVEKYIQGTVNETLRVWAKYSEPGTLILPYTLCQENGTNFFSEVLILLFNSEILIPKCKKTCFKLLFNYGS